ncbi:hypothetical protein RKD56_000523 [Priestia megaterium]
MSNNLWGDLTDINEKKNPLDTLKEQSGYLLNATNNMIYTDLRSRQPQTYRGEPECEFAVVYSIKSKVMEKYEFQLFTLYHNITFYPMYFEADENLREILDLEEYHEVKNELEFTKLLKQILDNHYTKDIIASLYAMSK